MSENKTYLVATVESIPKEKFEDMCCNYTYTSHRIRKIQDIIWEKIHCPLEEGKTKRETKDKIVFNQDILSEILTLMRDLEFRLKEMFGGEDREKAERMKRLHAEGKMGKRKKATIESIE